MANDPIDPTNIAATTELVAQAEAQVKNYGITATSALGQVVEAFRKQKEAAQQAASGLSGYEGVAKLTSNVLQKLGVDLGTTSQAFQKINSLTQTQTNQIATMSTALMGASKLFAGIGDNSGLNNFSSQITNIISSAKGITGPFKAIADAMGFKDVNLGNLSSIKTEMLAMATNLGKGTDSALAFSRETFNLAARTGTLGELYTRTGAGLANLNNVSLDAATKLQNIGVATNLTQEEVGKYYTELGKLPEAYKQVIGAGDRATGSTTDFQKIIQLAHGTGQTFNEVLGQTVKMWENYGKVGDDALAVTARATDLQKLFGLRLEDTTGFLSTMSDSFKLLGDNTDGVSKIFNQFFSGLREGGLGIKPAIDTIAQMSSSLSSLTMAQKAFLSGRTGGPGGLLGAINIEKDLAAGKSAEVFDKLRQAFTQQVGGQGNIISREQVGNQQQAAEFTRQRQLLQSGAFGGVAKTDEQAAAILKAFQRPNQEGIKNVAEIIKGSVAAGSDIEKKSNTELVRANASLDQLKLIGSFIALNTIQKGTTAEGTGALRDQLAANVAEAAARSTEKRGTGQDTSREETTRTLEDLARNVGRVGTTTESMVKAAKENFASPKSTKEITDAQNEEYRLKKSIIDQQRNRIEGAGSTMTDTSRASALKNVAAQEAALEASRTARPATRASQVGEATAASLREHAAASRSPAGNVSAHAGAPTAPGKTGEKLDLTVNVYVDGKKQTSQAQVQTDGGVANMNGH